VQYGIECCELVESRGAALVLALDSRWLARSAEEVVQVLEGLEVPVALVLEAAYDPLGLRTAIQGLVHLLASHEHVRVLRADVQGLGGIAYGAMAAAIGTNSSLRHLHPPRHSGRGGAAVHDRSPSVLVRRLGRYAHGSWLQQVEDDEGLLTCRLDCCYGQPLQRFGAPDEHGTLAMEAVVHNVTTTRALASELLGCSPADRPVRWGAYCRDAHNANATLFQLTGIRQLRPPPYLTVWAEL
jgi:hypothetical protein